MMSWRRQSIGRKIGAGGDVVPEYSTGEYKEGDVFLICSDGFRHKLKREEMESIFGGGFGSDEELKAAAKRAVEISKERKERDNTTVIAVAMAAENQRKNMYSFREYLL